MHDEPLAPGNKIDLNAEGSRRDAQPVDTESPPRLPFTVVGIGASAGGLEAVTELLSTIRPDSGMAYVFLQHLPPTGESLLAEILGRRVSIPVLEVNDQMPVEVNHLYVKRPGRTLTIKDGRFHVGERLERPMHNRPVDDFFRALAEEQRERAVAVVLSGMGSNGTAGAQAIKAVGGLCIAQEPETAQFPSMPRHLIDAACADYILRPSDIPDVLLAYAGHPYASGDREKKAELARRDQQHLREILAVLRTRTRQDFVGYKKPTILRRVQRRMGINRISRLADYSKILRQNPIEVSTLADDLLIHVTGFFRDSDAWESLRQKVIVPLIASREPNDQLRCWVTACSSGEEAYSLAMLLVEQCERVGKPLDIKIFATDMAERTLQNARGGTYAGGIESEIEPDRLERFFEKEDAVYRVRQDLRELVVFAPQNLLQDPPFSRLDIVSCRNLLIYLEPAMQQRVLGLLHFGLREGGTLFLGTSETVGNDDLFQVVDKKARIYRRIGATRHGSTDFPLPRVPASPARLDETGPVEKPSASSRMSIAQLTSRTLLEEHTPSAVTIDRDYRIVYFHGDVDPFIRSPRGEPTRHLMDVVRDTLRGAVRTAVHRAFASNSTVTVNDATLPADGGMVQVEVIASPIGRKESPEYFVVSFQQRSHSVPPSPDEDAGSTKDDSADEIRRIRNELQSTIEELQTSNEELKVSHEEVVSTNEELQSTNEELETSREEMQSLNEELSTVNSQLHGKMEEHQATSNDLASLLSSTDIAVLFLDPRLRIRRFTSAMRRLMDLIPSDMGRPINAMARKFQDVELLTDAQSVLENLVPIEREVIADDGRWYLRRLTPYRTADNRIDGVVITFVDISARRIAERHVFESDQRLRAWFKVSTDAMYRMSPDWGILILMEGNSFLSDTPQSSQTWLERYIPLEDQARVTEAFETAIREKSTFELEHQVQRADGSIGWTLSRAIPILGTAGAIIEWFGIATDITARKRAEEEVRKSEERQAFLLKLSDSLRLLADAGEIKATATRLLADRLKANRCCYAEIDGDDFVIEHGFARDLPAMPARVSMSRWGKPFLDVFRIGTTMAIENVHTSLLFAGEDVSAYDAAGFVSGIGVPLIKDGSWEALLGISNSDARVWTATEIQLAEDVAERTWAAVERANAEATLRTREAELASLANVVPDLLWRSDPDGSSTWSNQRWLDYTGQTLEEASGWGWLDVIHPDDRERSAATYRQCVAAKADVHQEYRIRRQDGEHRWFLMKAKPLLDAGGNVIRYFGAATDIHEQRIALDTAHEREELLRRSRAAAEAANRMKDEFLATLSHELRTPLSSILLWANLLRRKPEARPFDEEIRSILSSAHAQKTLIEDLLDMSRITNGSLRLEMRNVNLLDTVRRAISDVDATARAKSVELYADLNENVSVVHADPNRIRQIVWNLLSNAVKFTRAGGKINISTRRIGSHVEVRVSDNGIGIAPEFLPHMFERFRQAESSYARAAGGLGLGLAIVKQLVELHGGSIEARSVGINHGAEFVVRLPLPELPGGKKSDAGPAGADAANGPADDALDGLMVLLVEDDEQTRDALTAILVHEGMRVLAADNAQDALRSVQESNPDLIISDIGLSGADGYTLIQSIRKYETEQNLQPTPALALTAFAGEVDRRRAIEVGFQKYLSKPVDPEQILDALKYLSN